MKYTRPMVVPARWRRLARNVALVGVVLSGVGLFSEISDALSPGAAAAGTLTMNPVSGDSGTTFSLVFASPPAPQVCPGDNTASYLWHTFITPATNDPAPMTYSPSGIPSGPAFTNNLANSIATRSRNNLPGLGDGLVVAPTGLSFSNAFYAGVTPGDYWIGIACTLPDNTDGTVNTAKYWASRVTVSASAGAGPNNFTYAASAATTTTTSSSTTTSSTTAPTGTATTVVGAATTTTLAGTTTTVAGATSTSVPCSSGATTPSTAVAGATTTTTTTTAATTTTVACVTATTTTAPSTLRTASGGVTNQAGGNTQSLATTGPSSLLPWLIVWGTLLLAFGRMVILLGRPIRLVADRR